MRKRWQPAYTEYSLTLERGSERFPYYNGQVYSSLETAQWEAEKMNERRKQGRVIVESRERPAAYVYETTLHF